MSAGRKAKSGSRKARASSLCEHFASPVLVGSARAGLEALEAEDRAMVSGGGLIGCGIALDRCRQPHDRESNRWDYAFALRDSTIGFALESHHATADEIDVMILKKKWAEELLARECPELDVQFWCWLASPPEGKVMFHPQHPRARLLALAGISFPKARLVLPDK